MGGFKVLATAMVGVLILGWLVDEPDEGEPKPPESPSAIDNSAADEPDSAADSNAEQAPSEPEKPASPWHTRVGVSPMDDSKSVFLSTTSNERVPGRYGKAPARVALYVRCVENTTSLILEMNGNHMASSSYHDWGHVQMRIDENRAFTKAMTESTDNSSLGLWSGGNSIPVIKQMFGAEKLTLRATPYSESPITMTFDIGQLEDDIAPLREACHW